MVIEIIPAGASAIATVGHHQRDDYRGRDCDKGNEHVLQAINDLSNAEGNRFTDLANAEGTRYGNVLGAVKDAEADLERSSGQHFGDTVCAVKDAEADVVRTVKDAQADLERSSGLHYADNVRTVKDAEARILKDAGDKFINVIQDVKDAESRLMKDAGDKFINLVQDVKDAESRLLKDSGDKFIQTIQDVKEVEIAVERSKGKVVEAIRQSEFEGEKSHSRTRERMDAEFRHLERDVYRGFDESKVTAYKLAMDADKTACANQMQTLLQFKDQALLSEKLAAHQELLAEKLAAAAAAQAAECCCELKEKIGAEADETRALINRIETDRLRDKAAKAENQLAAYFARGVAPVVP